MLYELRAKIRYVTGLWQFLRASISPQDARELIKSSLAKREENFLKLAEFGIYGKADSPFRKLLLHTGVQMSAGSHIRQQRPPSFQALEREASAVTTQASLD